MGAARLALGILGGLFSGRLAKQPAKTIRGVLTLDFLRQTCFAGCFVGTYKAVLAWLGARRRKGQKEGATGGPPTSLDAAIAAAIAGLTIMIDDPGRRRTVSLYLASRATAMLLRIAVARRVLPRIPLFSALVFTLAQVPNMTALVFEPDCLNADYYRLILKWSRDITPHTLHNVVTAGKDMTPPLDDSFHSCEAIGFHPGPCASYHLHDMTLNWLATAKMYLPIYLLPQLLFKMPAVRSRPLDVLVKVSTNIFNSGMMLASYITAMKGSICVMRHLTQRGRLHWTGGAVGGAATGVAAMFWEPESRRRELAIYVVPQGLTTVWNKLQKCGIVRPVPGFETVFFCLSMSSLMWALHGAPEKLKPWMKSALGHVVEGEGPGSDSDRHQAASATPKDATAGRIKEL